MLAKLIMDGKNLKHLRLLSLSTHVSEEALLVMLKKMPFPNLEVVKIQSQFLHTNTVKLRIQCQLPKLKKLNLKGCSVKLDQTSLRMCGD